MTRSGGTALILSDFDRLSVLALLGVLVAVVALAVSYRRIARKARERDLKRRREDEVRKRGA